MLVTSVGHQAVGLASEEQDEATVMMAVASWIRDSLGETRSSSI